MTVGKHVLKWILLLTTASSAVWATSAQTNMKEEDIIARVKAQVLKELQAEQQAKESVDMTPAEPIIESKQLRKPQFNFLELEGYYRLRSDFFYKCDLGTYIPNQGPGTSTCPPPLSYFDPAEAVPNSGAYQGAPNRPASLFTNNMRLRIEPTLNISEDIRIKSTIDALDNLVLGSLPNYMARVGSPSPLYPIGILSMSQNYPIIGINTPYSSVNVRRIWGEIAFPFGELRFGRIPFNFGLGMLYNSGNQFDDDYGDTIDAILFATRIYGHYLIPGYSITLSGPWQRGGGSGIGGDMNQPYFPGEMGQRMDLDPSDNIHTFLLTFAKKDSEEDIKMRTIEGNTVVNYGVLATYRFQLNDAQYTTFNLDPEYELRQRMQPRNAQVGIASLFGSVFTGNFDIQMEAAGILGKIGYTNFYGFAPEYNIHKPLWLLQGGIALKSRYGFFNNRLGVGLDAGLASGGRNPGFGLREILNPRSVNGDFDGPQFGPPSNTNYDTHFRFNPDYHVDLILFREILGTVTNAFYLRPHVGYKITEGLEVRGDVIASFASSAKATPGNSNLLGVEIDATGKYKTEDGFMIMLQYGVLIPLNGLNHTLENLVANHVPDAEANYRTYGTARVAQTVQLYLGIEF